MLNTTEDGLLKDPSSGACVYTPEAIQNQQSTLEYRLDKLEQSVTILTALTTKLLNAISKD